MSIILYHMPATSSTPIQWALEELGIPYEKVHVNLNAGEQRRPEFLAINPNGKVPTLVVDGTPLWESIAIVTYLGDQHGVSKGLWPAPGTPEHLQALSWTAWVGGTLRGALGLYLTAKSERSPKELHSQVHADHGRKEVMSLLGILDERLGKHDYIVGSSFTLVDALGASLINFIQHVGIDAKSLPNVAAWLERAMKRPALGQVFAQTK